MICYFYYQITYSCVQKVYGLIYKNKIFFHNAQIFYPLTIKVKSKKLAYNTQTLNSKIEFTTNE
jgi:hypothetical protein